MVFFVDKGSGSGFFSDPKPGDQIKTGYGSGSATLVCILIVLKKKKLLLYTIIVEKE